ncbi:MAG: DUF4384 domain-containing protein [Nitrospirae bacterium]|nr:DUF4384 domain-containing protein [Nitrospirota bacterium]
MKNILYRVICAVAIVMPCFVGGISVYSAEPTGAKGLFEYNENKVSVETEDGERRKKTTVTTKTKVVRERNENVIQTVSAPHIGIKYTVMLISDDGIPRPVSDKRVFRTGDRIRIIAQVNRPGYLTVYNVGPTGNVNYLHNGPVSPYTPLEIPSKSAMRIVDPPGTETIVFQISSASDKLPVGGRPNCKPETIMASSKDIVVEDAVGSNYAVLSNTNCNIDRTDSKDIKLENDSGENYGVIPSRILDEDKSFLVEIKLKHRS